MADRDRESANVDHASKPAGDRRAAEARAEAPREGVENVPEGKDIQDLVGGQEKTPPPRKAPPHEEER